MSTGDEILLPAEVAGMLRVPIKTLAYWRTTGFGPESFRMGRRVLYTRAGVEQFTQNQITAARAKREREHRSVDAGN